jgi:hypothetical protein
MTEPDSHRNDNRILALAFLAMLAGAGAIVVVVLLAHDILA